jgi:hypothetical protein
MTTAVAIIGIPVWLQRSQMRFTVFDSRNSFSKTEWFSWLLALDDCLSAFASGPGTPRTDVLGYSQTELSKLTAKPLVGPVNELIPLGELGQHQIRSLFWTHGQIALTAGPSTTLRSPGFPVELGGVGELHAAFRNESSTRGCVRRCVAGNPGPVGMTILFEIDDFPR